MKIIMALMTVVFALIFAVAILPAADDMITDEEEATDGIAQMHQATTRL